MTAVMESQTDMAGRPADPLEHVKRGDILTAEQLRTADEYPCRVEYHPYGLCGRPHAHPDHWQHIGFQSPSAAGVVLATWHNENALDISDAPPEIEQEETPLVSTTAGTLCRFRNRRDLLMILGKTRKGSDTVEALNLTRQRFCKLRIDRLVERKDTDPDPTQEQMAWVGQFLADRKHAIAQIGQREVDSRRWTRAEMEQSLGKADITPPPLRWAGTLNLSLDFQLPHGAERPTNAHLQQLVVEALGATSEKSTDKITLKDIQQVVSSNLLAS